MIVRGNLLVVCGVAVVAAARAFVLAPPPLPRVPSSPGTVGARPPDDARMGDRRRKQPPQPARTKARLYDDHITRKLRDHGERIRELERDVTKASERDLIVQADVAVLRTKVGLLVEQVDRILDTGVSRTKAEGLKDDVAVVRTEAKEHKYELKDDVADLRTEANEHKIELKNDVADFRAEAKEHKSELKNDVAELRAEAREHKIEIQNDVAYVRGEAEDHKFEIKNDVADLRTAAEDHKFEIKNDVAGVRKEAKVHKNELKCDVADVRTEAKENKNELTGTIEKAATEIKEQVELVKELLSSVEDILRASSKS
jgi:chromosome segregation ATPase